MDQRHPRVHANVAALLNSYSAFGVAEGGAAVIITIMKRASSPVCLARWRPPLPAIFLCLFPLVVAADTSWTGATSTDWGTNGNWSSGGPSASENAVFDATFSNQPSVSGNQNIGGLWMTDSVGQDVTISGSGTLNPKGNTIRAKSGVGLLVDNTNAFTLTITAAIQLGGDQAWLNNSGNLLTISGTGGVNLTDVDLSKDDLTIDGTGNTLISTSLRGQGNFTKTGSGTLTLTGLNTYTDPTTVLGGTLQVGVGGTGTTGTAATTVGNGVTAATLAGTGTVGGTVSSTNHAINGAAFLKPGDNSGSSNGGLAFNGNLNLNDNSQTQLKITGRTATAGDFGGNAVGSAGYLAFIAAHISTWKAAPKGDHDWIQINGTLTLGQNGSNGLIQVVDNGYVANAQAGDVFDLIDWSLVSTGSFDPGTNYRSGGLSGDLSLPDLSSKGLFWDVSQFTSNGILIVDVPEPSRVILLTIGGAVLLLRRAQEIGSSKCAGGFRRALIQWRFRGGCASRHHGRRLNPRAFSIASSSFRVSTGLEKQPTAPASRAVACSSWESHAVR